MPTEKGKSNEYAAQLMMTKSMMVTMPGSSVGLGNPLPLLSLLLFLLSPSASADGHPSRCALPREFSGQFPPILSDHQLCTCDSDWADAFCARLSAYERMAPEKAPSVCVCRQSFGVAGCVQFLTRCFRRPLHTAIGGTHQHVQHRLRREQCACCFNQPDPFCTQLDCAQMRPQFDGHSNTSCHCHLPHIGDGTYAPSVLCRQQSQLFTREVMPQPSAAEAKSDEPGPRARASSFRPSFGSLLPPVSSPFIRFFALLLLILIAVTLSVVAICLLNNWKRIRLRRRERHRAKEKRTEGAEEKGGQSQKGTSNGRRTGVTIGNGLLEEATV